jgi:predicted nucleic acid-binding protein
VRVFLDANVLFSAALGGESFALLWQLGRAGKVSLLTSRACVLEAERNLERKRPAALDAFREALASVALVPEAPERLASAAALVGENDAHVLAAALEARAAVLVTGDMTHFGALMERDDVGLRVRTIRRFLLERPSQAPEPG